MIHTQLVECIKAAEKAIGVFDMCARVLPVDP
jgi:hypothetical protein